MVLRIPDSRFYHLETQKRYFKEKTQVQSIGYIPQKTDWVKKSFRTMNFSLILSGRGFYRSGGTLHPLQAPMVLTQEPGCFADYGPRGTWEELFLIYPEESCPYFLETGLYKRETPFWKIREPEKVFTAINRLLEFLESKEQRLKGDQIDHKLKGLLMKTHMEGTEYKGSPEEVFVREVHEKIRNNPGEDCDFHRIAIAKGFSPSTFRRYWNRFYGEPPGKIQSKYRIQEACRLLAETDEPVNRIAGITGFADALYFSRLFRKKMKESPREYRLRTRAPYFTP